MTVMFVCVDFQLARINIESWCGGVLFEEIVLALVLRLLLAVCNAISFDCVAYIALAAPYSSIINPSMGIVNYKLFATPMPYESRTKISGLII